MESQNASKVKPGPTPTYLSKERLYIFQCLLVCERTIILAKYQQALANVSMYGEYLTRGIMPPISNECLQMWRILTDLRSKYKQQPTTTTSTTTTTASNSNNTNSQFTSHFKLKNLKRKEDMTTYRKQLPVKRCAGQSAEGIRQSGKYCMQCGINFPSKFNYKRHVNAVHLKIKQFTCRVPGCDRKFSSKANRDLHSQNTKIHLRKFSAMKYVSLSTMQYIKQSTSGKEQD